MGISADGNTAIIGGPGDTSVGTPPAWASSVGAAWVFTRSGGVWAQQGNKLVGTGAGGFYGAGLGTSVAIAGDGNTVIVGGPWYSPWFGACCYRPPDWSSGAAWVFTRSGGVWAQQGEILKGTNSDDAEQGTSVAISAGGDTAIVGGPQFSFGVAGPGAAWMYTRSGGTWSQQGSKLVGTGGDDAASQGTSVAISADGNTAVVGGPIDNAYAGAAWVYTRSGDVWSQQGSKLVGRDGAGAQQGRSVAISPDGSTVIVGGPWDNSGVGAAWVFVASGCTAPSIYTQPQSQFFPNAQTATLTVGATGLLSLSYQWYQGSSGDTSNPVGTNSSSFTTPTLTSTTNYWVRVSNACGHTDSATATVWIGCVPPSIAAQPQGATIASGQTATLSVTAVGTTPLGYEWYQGASGDTSQPVGFNASGFTTPALTATTSYWVRVSNACGQADSAAATITVWSSFIWIPAASHNRGLNHSQWRSDLGLPNPGTVTANVQIEFFGSSGVVRKTTDVSAGVQSILTDIVGQLGASGSGAIEVVSDQPLKVTARSYNQIPSDASCDPNGTQGQDYPAVVASDGLVAGQSAYLAGLAENASYRTNIGLVNVGPDWATVLTELYDGAGTKLGDYTLTLATGQWSQETQPFFNKAGQTAMDRGYARITVQTGSGVFGFASVIDNITNDPTTVAMQR